MLKFFELSIKPLVDDLDEKLEEHHKKDNCVICKGLDAAIKHPTIEDHLKALDELEHTAPYGRCTQDGLALSEAEAHMYGDMHQSCAEDFYE